MSSEQGTANASKFQLSTKRLVWPLLQAGLFLLIACWIVWPIPRYIDQAVPIGDSPTGTVPMLNCWTIFWNARQVACSFAYYWHAPIFSNHGDVFALAEPQPATIIVSPFERLFNILVAYNVYLILSLTLNGVFASRFLSRLKVGAVAATCGGIAVCLHPLAVHNLEVLELIPLWSILWTWERWLAIIDDRPVTVSTSIAQSLLLGLALTITVAICLHQAFLLGILLVGSIWVLWDSSIRKCWRRVSAQLGLAALVMLLSTGYYVSRIQEIRTDYGLRTSPETVAALSAKPNDWLTQTDTSLTRLNKAEPLEELSTGLPLSPGLFRCISLIVLFTLWLRHPASEVDRAVRFLGCVGILSWLLSFGSNWTILQWSPWSWAAEHFPGFSAIRGPYGFAYFSQLSVLLLVVLLLDFLWRSFKQSLASIETLTPGHLFRTKLVRLGTLAVLVFVTFEVPPPRTSLMFPPIREQQEEWPLYVRQTVRSFKGLLCLPVAENDTEQAMQQATSWMMYSLQHGHPILNGYSRFTPPQWSNLRERIRKDEFDEALLLEIQSLGAAAIVVRKDRFTGNLTPIEHLLEKGYEDESVTVWHIPEGQF